MHMKWACVHVYANKFMSDVLFIVWIKHLLLLWFIMYFTTTTTNDMRCAYLHAHVKWAREHVYANELTPDMLSGRCYSLTAGMHIVNC